jgi:[acyl-carrier-protein] S-malonyltransferase
MSSIAFLFPGQGSHEVGMGADLLRSDEWVRSLVRQVSATTGEDIERLCLRGPEKRLMRSAFIQPLLTIICLGYWRRLVDAGLRPDIVAGHSLGEIATLAAAGVLTPEQAVAVAGERGRLMDEVADRTPGGMAAVFISLRETEEHIARFGMIGNVFVANDNAPEQVVVSAAVKDLDAFVRRMDGVHAGRCKPLRVSGPWHTPLLEDAHVRFDSWLAAVPFGSPTTPLVSNATAQVESDPACLRAYAARQLTQRVRWRETMAELRARGVNVLVEVGPRRVLAGLARLNGFGEETVVRGVDSLRAVETVSADHFVGGGK